MFTTDDPYTDRSQVGCGDTKPEGDRSPSEKSSTGDVTFTYDVAEGDNWNGQLYGYYEH